MENRDNQHSDVNKIVQAQQLLSERSQQPEQAQQGQDATGQAHPSESSGADQSGSFQSQQSSETSQSQSPAETSQADYGRERQSDTLTGERGDGETAQSSDIEGASANQSGGSFLGTEATTDTSSELIEDDSDFARDGQGAPE
jgi:hypothetical protein